MTLRVARDGPVVPVTDAGRPGMSVDDRTVTYRFDDPWALFTMITLHRETDAPATSDARSQLLRFEFPIVTNIDNPLIVLTVSRARVFVRVAVSAAGKRKPLAWPGAFPVRVPAW